MTYPVDWAEAKFWLDSINVFITCGIGVYLYSDRRHRVTDASIAGLRADVDARFDGLSDRLVRLEERQRAAPTASALHCSGHAERLATVERAMEAAPSVDDLARIHRRIDVIADDVSGLAGEFKQANKTLDMIHEHMLLSGARP